MKKWQTSILDEFNQAFNDHDIPAMMALMSDDCLFENTYPPPDGRRYQGAEAVAAFWSEFFTASAGAHLDIEETFSAGDHACQCWIYRWEGANPGHVRGVDVFQFRDGKISAKRSYVKG